MPFSLLFPPTLIISWGHSGQLRLNEKANEHPQALQNTSCVPHDSSASLIKREDDWAEERRREKTVTQVFYFWCPFHIAKATIAQQSSPRLLSPPHCINDVVSWEPEGRYHYSKMFRWEPEGPYRCTKSIAITPFWFSMEHRWIVIGALLALNWWQVHFCTVNSAQVESIKSSDLEKIWHIYVGSKTRENDEKRKTCRPLT